MNPLTPGAFLQKKFQFEAAKAIVWLPSRRTEMQQNCPKLYLQLNVFLSLFG